MNMKGKGGFPKKNPKKMAASKEKLSILGPSEKRKEESPTVSDDEHDTAAIFQRICEIRRDLDAKIANIYEEGKRINLDLDVYFDYVDQLSKQGKLSLQSNHKEMFEKLNKAFKRLRKKKAKSKETLTKERKTKTIGARKKNWIPMR
jgi:hypothetical protein